MDETYLKILKSGWLARVPSGVADLLVGSASPVRFGEGETVYGFGQRQNRLFGVVSGTVRMWVTMNEQEPRFGHIAGPGFWFGETELVTGKAGIMEMAAYGETLLYAIDRPSIDRLGETIPGIWQAIALLAVMNQGTAIGAADDLLIRNSEQRLAAVLLRLSSRRSAFQGVPPLDRLPVTRAELAEVSSLSQSTTAALVADFVRSGLIRTGYREIVLENPAGLTEIIGS